MLFSTIKKPKKHPNQTFLGNFVDRKVWGNFGQWGVKKKFGCSGFAVSFFHYGGGHAPHNEKNETANPEHPNFFLTPHCPKFSQTFLSTKFPPKVWFGCFFWLLKVVASQVQLPEKLRGAKGYRFDVEADLSKPSDDET